MPWVPMKIHEPAVICPYIVRPSVSSRRNSSQVGHSGTRLELAISTRGDHSCVRNTPTGLPDWTSSVSSPSSWRSVATIASNASHERARGGTERADPPPRGGGAAGPAVDDQVLRALGDLGIEVVHQHAQGGL